MIIKLPKRVNVSDLPEELRLCGMSDVLGYCAWKAAVDALNTEYTKKKYEDLGIGVLGEEDSLEFIATIPNGWTTKAHDDGYWKSLYDENDNEVLSYFEKFSWENEAFTCFND